MLIGKVFKSLVICSYKQRGYLEDEHRALGLYVANKKPGVGPGWQDKLLIQVFVEASSVDVV